MTITPEQVQTLGAIVVAILGSQGIAKLIDLWRARQSDRVDADLKLAGGWRALAEHYNQRIEALEQEIEELRCTVLALTKENTQLHADNDRLAAEVEVLEKRMLVVEKHGG